MIITVTAPKKGLGQTTTTINLAAGLVKLTSELKIDSKILIIDINKYCKDIEYYLSNTVVSRGLDDFFSLYQSELLTDDSFKTCIKKINDNISIIGSNEYFEISDEAITELFKMADRMYDFVIIDSIGTSNISGIQKTIFDLSDKIIVDKVLIDGTQISMELNMNGQANLLVLNDNVQNYLNTSAQPAKETKPVKTQETKQTDFRPNTFEKKITPITEFPDLEPENIYSFYQIWLIFG